jgi:hypothetical protein
MKDLSQTFDTMHASFKAKVREDGKQKEPVCRSLNDWNLIKALILKQTFKRTGFTPAAFFPNPGELDRFLTKPATDEVRAAWYRMSSKYRNNFDVN